MNAVNSLIQFDNISDDEISGSHDEISNDEISDDEFSAFFETEPKGEPTVQTFEEMKKGPNAIC